MEVIAQRYHLGEPLGSGGMARVHRAHDRVLARDVAIKLLREDIGRDPTLYERFLREARLAGSLAHANVVRVYDAGVEGETPWMAMELVDGPSLRERMTDRGPYPLEEALEVMGQVLDGLDAAHRSSVVHRDIKPANVLLAPEGAKLGDFGIAKSLGTIGADLTQANQFMGTPKYTAPEVALGDPATSRSDLYSAAVVLWEMLAGHPPFDHANPLTLAMMHRTDPLPSLSAARPDLPEGVVAAIEQALAKEPGARPPDAATFRRTLMAGAGGEVPLAAAEPTVPLPPAAGGVGPLGAGAAAGLGAGGAGAGGAGAGGAGAGGAGPGVAGPGGAGPGGAGAAGAGAGGWVQGSLGGREATRRLEVPPRPPAGTGARQVSRPPARRDAPGSRTWLVVLLVGALVGAAALAFALAGAEDDGAGAGPEGPTPTAVPTSSVPEPTAVPPPVAPAEPPAPAPEPPPPPAVTPEPTTPPPPPAPAPPVQPTPAPSAPGEPSPPGGGAGPADPPPGDGGGQAVLPIPLPGEGQDQST